MTTIAFIGDEVTAAGYRLCGVRVLSPSPDGAMEALNRLRAEGAMMVLMTAAYADTLPAAELQQALLGQKPPLLLVDDAAGAQRAPDPGAQIRRLLGLAPVS